MQLSNQSKNLILAAKVTEAKSFGQRLVGLLGKASLPNQEALWIHSCRSIHTWFMRFPIDVIFVDRQLEVKAVFENIRPWRMILPVWKAESVFELAAGQLHAKVEVGDQLHVGT